MLPSLSGRKVQGRFDQLGGFRQAGLTEVGDFTFNLEKPFNTLAEKGQRVPHTPDALPRGTGNGDFLSMFGRGSIDQSGPFEVIDGGRQPSRLDEA